jgi:glycosyltransferase involved in cell wall biosynthesis
MASGQNQNSDREVAYIMSRFPKITETFILREILELERQGERLIILPLLKERQNVVHPEVDQVKSPVHYTRLISWAIFKANLFYLGTSPVLYLQTLWRVLLGNLRSANLFIGAAGIFPKSVYFARLLSHRNVRHVHAHFATHPALSAYVIAKLTGLSFSFTVHAHDIFVHSAMLAEKLETAEFVVAISEYNKRYLCRRFPHLSNKIRVVHCGITPENYEPKLNRDAARAGSGFALVTVASLQVYKGIEYLVRACALLIKTIPDLKCTVIGEGPERNALTQLIDRLELNGVVSLVGLKSQEDVSIMLANSDLFVLPSIVAPDGQMEGIPVALMEAMASELPVVSTEISGIPELVKSGESGLLAPPSDEVALAEAIAELFRDAEARQRMGSAGRRVVELEFDLTSNVRKLKQLFDDSSGSDTAIAGDAVRCVCDISNVVPGRVISVQPAKSAGRDSEVIIVRLQADNQAEKDVAIKFHRPSNASTNNKVTDGLFHAENEYRALQRLWAAFHDSNDNLHIPKPLALIPERAAVVTEYCPGVRLDRLLRYQALPNLKSTATDLTRTFESVGNWLARFHSVTSNGRSGANALLRLRNEFASDLSVCRKLPFEGALLDKVKNQFERDFNILAQNHGPVVNEHCDFGPHNVFVDGDEVTVIDFEGVRDGFTYSDLAYFVCLIELMPSRHLTARQKTDLRNAFLIGYGSNNKIRKDVQRFYEIPTLIKLTAHNPVFEGTSTPNKLQARMLLRAYTRQLKELVNERPGP